MLSTPMPTADDSSSTTASDTVRVEGLVKRFPGVTALAGVDLRVARGEIHALVGGNGSGKSTLIKVLAGVEHGDDGSIEVLGMRRAATDVTPNWALPTGLGFVHQDLGLIGDLTVAENIFLGLPYPKRRGRIDWKQLADAAADVLAQLDIGVRPNEPLAGLRASDRTLVAVGRATRGRENLHSGALVLDEPTAKLAAAEVEHLLRALRRYAAMGQSILYVSHRLDEVLGIADRITVLRDGRVVDSAPARDFDYARLATLIAGRDLPQLQGRRVPIAAAGCDASTGHSGGPVLRVRNLHAGPLAGIDLDVAPGEVVGLAGLVGSGRSRLLKTLFGAERRSGGDVAVADRPLPRGNVAATVRAGVGYVPEDRAREGALLGLSVRENLAACRLAANQQRGPFGLRGPLRLGAELRACEQAIERFSIRCPGPDGRMAQLSGGNQQKIVLARWLDGDTHLLLLDEPTQGVDVGARAEIYACLREARDRGLAAVVASSDTDELVELCDRVLVLAGGRIVAEARGKEITHDWIAEHVYGHDAVQEDV